MTPNSDDDVETVERRRPLASARFSTSSGATLVSSSTELSTDGDSKYRRLHTLSISAEPVSLSWENLSVLLPSRKPRTWKFGTRDNYEEFRKPILNNVSGLVQPGEMLAVMGASGAGKTTLLNALVSRNLGNLVREGSIKVNGEEIGDGISSVSAYVQQDDLFIGTLTVREHLIFQALLRLPSSLSYKDKIERADQVLFELGLTKCQHTRIGVRGLFQGISGGEAKRLAVAAEILRNPGLLFCDEPTSGLDSFLAENVISVLQQLASKGKSVICTIHQPASEVYAMFDRVLFLAEGHTAFLGSRADALIFFEKSWDCERMVFRLGYPCPLDFNPADHIVETLAVVPGQEAESRARIEHICYQFEETDEKRDMDERLKELALSRSLLELRALSAKRSRYQTGWLMQFCVLLCRSLVNSYRNRTIVATKLITKIVFAIFLGLSYLYTINDQVGVMNVNGALFFLLSEVSVPTYFGILNAFPQEYSIICREHHAAVFRLSSYYASKIVSMIPIYSVDGVVLILISYYMIGLDKSVSKYFICMGICILVEQAAASFGCFVSASAPSLPVAAAAAGPVLIVFQVTGGLYANVQTIPSYISWTQWLSWFRYGYELLSINQWHDIDHIDCAVNATVPCYQSGNAVLTELLSFSPNNFVLDIGLLVALYVAFNTLGFIGLSIRVSKSR